jgi:hypothetical protein
MFWEKAKEIYSLKKQLKYAEDCCGNWQKYAEARSAALEEERAKSLALLERIIYEVAPSQYSCYVSIDSATKVTKWLDDEKKRRAEAKERAKIAQIAREECFANPGFGSGQTEACPQTVGTTVEIKKPRAAEGRKK